MQVTDEEKKALLGGAGYFNDYVIKFPSVTITNETIHQESVSIKQAITGDGDLEFGGCIASTFEFEVSEVLLEELKGQEFTAELLVNNGDAARIKMGTYTAEIVTQVDDNDYKKVVGYDAFYKMQEDVTEWYNDYFKKTPETTLGKFVNDLLEYFGVSSVTKSFANDNISISKTVEATNGITGQVLLKMACVLAGGFGVINRDGKFEIIYLDEETLFPEENLYPEETLYPEDSSYEYLGLNDGKEEVSYPEYRTVTYEEYNVQPATCLKLATDKDDVGAVIGDDLSNPFIITGNYFLYGKTTDELKKIGEKIAYKILSITYRPCDITADGMIWLDLGSRLALEKKNDDIITYLFSRELKGIQALTDTISAKGTEYRSNEVTANEEILNLKTKTLRIIKNTEELSANLKDLSDDTEASIKLVNEGIALEVKRATNEEKELDTKIEQTADEIVLKVDSNGNIVEVALGTDPDDESKTVFEVSADNINLSANDVINLLANGTINLTSSNINIESDNWNIDSKGNMTANAGTFGGTLDSVLGTFEKLSLGDYGENGIMMGDFGNGPILVTGNAVDVLFALANANELKTNKISSLAVERIEIGATTAIDAKGESHFSYGEYKDPVSNVPYAIKASGGIAMTGQLYVEGISLKWHEAWHYIMFTNLQYPFLHWLQYSNTLHIYPSKDSTVTLGKSDIRFANIYTMYVTTPSDRKLKKDIKEIDDDFAEKFIDGLIASSYSFKDNSYNKTHTGFIAQDVEELLTNMGLKLTDFAGLVKTPKKSETTQPQDDETAPTMVINDDYKGDDKNYDYSLRYDDFIAPLVKYCQLSKKRIVKLENKVAKLEEKLDLLLERIGDAQWQ